MKSVFVGLLSTLLLLGSCSFDSKVFSEYVTMDNMTWNRFDILEFEVPVQEDQSLDFHIFLRHHTDFPYDNLFVNITFYAPGGDTRSRDYEFDLRDYKGDWLAKGMGELWDVELLVRKEMMFSEDGVCRVRVENKYPKYDTPGIIEIGLIARASEN